MDPREIPEYAAAIRAEQNSRDSAFIGVTSPIGPFEVVPMTLWHFTVLRLMDNPLLFPAGLITPTPWNLFDFIWLLSPSYNPAGGPAREKLLKRCKKLFFPQRYLPLLNTAGARARYRLRHWKKLREAARLITVARAYVAECLQDRPAASKHARFDKDYYSDAAYFCAVLAREYGWPPDVTMRMPMKCLFQYLQEIRHHYGLVTTLSNPSDRVLANWMMSQNTRRAN